MEKHLFLYDKEQVPVMIAMPRNKQIQTVETSLF